MQVMQQIVPPATIEGGACATMTVTHLFEPASCVFAHTHLSPRAISACELVTSPTLLTRRYRRQLHTQVGAANRTGGGHAMDYETPNIDTLAREGVYRTHHA